MKHRYYRAMVALLSVCMTFSLAGIPVLAEKNKQDTEDLTGTLAFAQCEEYINIRSGADADSEITGKIYNDCAATIIGREGDWYQITSGNASGYVKAEYFLTGDAASEVADRTSYNVAKVYPEWLNVRTEPDEASDVADVAHSAQELEVLQWDGDWMKVAVGPDSYGYVNAYYVEYHTYYAVGETLEEEQQRIAGEQSAKHAAQEEHSSYTEAENTDTAQTEYVPQPEYAAEPENTEQAEYVPETEYTEPVEYAPQPEYTEQAEYVSETEYTEPVEYTPQPENTEQTAYVPEAEYTEPVEYVPQPENTEQTGYVEQPETETVYTDSALGQQIVDYALQFVGNPYVYGGTSLTGGADCSGFTQSVFANFGIGLSRTAESQSYGGYAVDMSSLQPGDLLFYGDGGYIGHVAIYIGGGQIVHASTEETGIIVSSYNYSTPVAARRYV
ncbi:MAG: NlpC/P60 family protein [Eubacteriales bacterium]|nr:NlpC/P60 family protein [Eubacteriales bacterium]